MNTNISQHFAHIAQTLEDCQALIAAACKDLPTPNLLLADMQKDMTESVEMLRSNVPPLPRKPLTDEQMEDLFKRLGGKPTNPTVNEQKIQKFLQSRLPEEKPQSNAKKAYAEWEHKVSLLHDWDRYEIAHCTKEIQQLLENHESSAKLAIVAAALQIAIQEGQ